MSPSPISPLGMSALAAAQQNALSSVNHEIADLNAQAQDNFKTAWNNWLLNWNAGRVADKSTAPKPPAGYVLAFFNDPTTGPGAPAPGPYGDMVIQWPYPALGTNPVVPQPPIPDVPAPQVSQNATGNGSVQNVAAGDTLPVGSIVKSADGSSWEKMATPTPWGVAFYYQKVN